MSEENVEQAIDRATESGAAQVRELDELAGTGGAMGIDKLLDVTVTVTVEVGRTRMSLADLIAVRPGSLVDLDRGAHEPADILVNGKVVAQGEIVTVGDSYGVRITSVEAMK